MNTDEVIARRMQSHLLSTPTRSLADTAAHMLATQGQEFWGGRWALAVRTAGTLTMSDVDAAFDRGEIVRSWTMRGTIHVVPAAELAWVLSITGARQHRAAAAVHRREGLDDDEWQRAERAALTALAGGNRLTRAELFAVFNNAGLATAGQRGYHLLVGLSVRGLVCQGPVVAREGGPTREQYIVRTDEWAPGQFTPADPHAEMFARFVASHGPAGARDFAWWAGLPLGIARAAADAASDRLVQVGNDPEPTYVVGPPPPASGVERTVIALPPFDEYYLSYADRTVACTPEFLSAVGPSLNGIVRPTIVADGRIVGVWTHSQAVARHAEAPIPELFSPGDAATGEVDEALARYRSFITG